MKSAVEPNQWHAFGLQCAERQVPLWLKSLAVAGLPTESVDAFIAGLQAGTSHPTLMFHWPEMPSAGWELVVMIGTDSGQPQPVGFDYMHTASGQLSGPLCLEPLCQQFNDLQHGWVDMAPAFFHKLGLRVLTVEDYKTILDDLAQSWA